MFIKFFKDINKKNVNIAGGKGASLGEMTKIGMPVPPGFVILAPAFNDFLNKTNSIQKIKIILDKVNYQDANSVNKASVKIQTLILKAKVPEYLVKTIKFNFKKLKAKYVAIRSSATAEDSSSASWAGILDTYLDTTERDLLLNIKKCWASLFTPRAIFYRHEKKLLNTVVNVGVIIQKMIESEVSGIAFTVHPVTKDKNQMIIEAGYGLGEAIVSGSITPDSYVLDKRDYSLLSADIATQIKKITKSARGDKWLVVPPIKQKKQKLGNKQIIELAKICSKIEKHYKFPCDIEWAYAKGNFYITQSRPITTL